MGLFSVVLFSINLYQPVFQAFLGFLVMATAIVETPIYFVVISCLLNITMCGVSLISIFLSSFSINRLSSHINGIFKGI